MKTELSFNKIKYLTNRLEVVEGTLVCSTNSRRSPPYHDTFDIIQDENGMERQVLKERSNTPQKESYLFYLLSNSVGRPIRVEDELPEYVERAVKDGYRFISNLNGVYSKRVPDEAMFAKLGLNGAILLD